MTQHLRLEGTLIHIDCDKALNTELPAYDEIRDEINKRNAVFKGSPNWQTVKDNCLHLGRTQWLDLRLCAYFTVATAKLDGLSGVASGLELLATALLLKEDSSNKALTKRKELIEWVSAQVVPDIKLFTPTYDDLRLLYRCERACEQIDTILTTEQPNHVANMESMAYALFEHIDRLELRHYAQKNAPQPLLENDNEENDNQEGDNSPKTTKQTKKHRVSYLLVGIIVILSVLLAYLIYSVIHSDPLLTQTNLRMQTNQSSNKNSLYQWQLARYIDKQDSSSLNWLGDSPKAQKDTLDELITQFPENNHLLEAQALWDKQQELGVNNANDMLARFQNTRSYLENININVQKKRYQRLEQNIQSVFKVSRSLSPIYARIGYIEEQLAKGDTEKAQQELDTLEDRIEAVNWKIEQLKTTKNNNNYPQ